MSGHLELLITPRRAGLVRGRDNVVDALIRVRAGKEPADRAGRPRPPLNIALVIDRSSSMSGEPLREACKAASFLADRLAASDRCAVVIYDDQVETLIPLAPVEDRERFRQALRHVTDRGSTNLHGGWFEGASALAPEARDSAISRVILLSDGEANAGLTDPTRICRHVERLAAAGVTTSTLGLGRNFNEALMTSMARAGRGRAHYGLTAADLLGPVSEELDLIGALAARRITCSVKAAADVGIEVLSHITPDTGNAYPLPDVAWESEAVLAVRLTLPARMTEGETLFELLSARVTLLDADGREASLDAEPLVLPVLGAAEWRERPVDETVARRFAEIEVARLQEAARDAVARGNWTEAERLIERIRPLAADNPWLGAILQESADYLRQREATLFSKSALYAADSLRGRIAAIDESGDLSAELGKKAYLARKLQQGRNRKPQ